MDRLWFLYVALAGHADGMAAAACTYDSWDLGDGARQPAAADVRASLAACDAPLRLAPIRGGALGVRATDPTQAELTRFVAPPDPPPACVEVRRLEMLYVSKRDPVALAGNPP